MRLPRQAKCPCGSEQLYRQCCGLYHAGGTSAPTAEALMRSRYAAYTLKMPGYIMRTTHPEGPQHNDNAASWRRDIERFCRATQFRGLEILEVHNDKDEAYVTFRATLFVGKDNHSFSERSLFRRHDGAWKYYSGEQLAES